jgi:hypothetical protein
LKPRKTVSVRTAEVEGFFAHGLKAGEAVVVEFAVTGRQDGQLALQSWHATATHWSLKKGATPLHDSL